MLKVNLQMMQNSQPSLATSSSPSSRCLYLRNTRAVASSCSDRSVSWSGGVFSNLDVKKRNWQNNIRLRWGDIYVVHFQDGTVRLLGVEAGLYLAMNRFSHFYWSSFFGLQAPLCLTKYMSHQMNNNNHFQKGAVYGLYDITHEWFPRKGELYGSHDAQDPSCLFIEESEGSAHTYLSHRWELMVTRAVVKRMMQTMVIGPSVDQNGPLMVKLAGTPTKVGLSGSKGQF